MKSNEFDTTQYSQLTKLAQKIASVIIPGLVITLEGKLGSGKSALVSEILKALGENGTIKSPTFTYCEPYKIGKYKIFHFDLYRFTSEFDWCDFGFDEYVSDESICFIEWASRSIEYISLVDWSIDMKYLNDDTRRVIISPVSDKGIKCLNQLIKPVVK